MRSRESIEALREQVERLEEKVFFLEKDLAALMAEKLGAVNLAGKTVGKAAETMKAGTAEKAKNGGKPAGTGGTAENAGKAGTAGRTKRGAKKE